jgi:hypothetical protein
MRRKFAPTIKEKPQSIKIRVLLFRQGSNLDSSDSESDVLPVTPRNNVGAKVKKFYENRILYLKLFSGRFLPGSLQADRFVQHRLISRRV